MTIHKALENDCFTHLILDSDNTLGLRKLLFHILDWENNCFSYLNLTIHKPWENDCLLLDSDKTLVLRKWLFYTLDTTWFWQYTGAEKMTVLHAWFWQYTRLKKKTFSTDNTLGFRNDCSTNLIVSIYAVDLGKKLFYTFDSDNIPGLRNWLS